MKTVPEFFLPAALPDKAEAYYEDAAKFCNCAAPSFEKRIYSIVFSHDGVLWTATVGETLKGIGTRTRRIRGKKVEQEMHHSDGATVLAIFAGNPYIVMTNEGLAGGFGQFANPFLAGEPRSVTYFSVAPTQTATAT
jgi:hypothetical protein